MTYVLSIEGNLIGWVGNAIILLTASLLIFHMTSIGSLEIHPLISAFIVSGLIICDALFTLTSLVPYNLRLDDIFKNGTQDDEIDFEKEKIYSKIYTFTVSVFLILQLLICYFVISDSIHRAKTMKKYKKSKLTKIIFG